MKAFTTLTGVAVPLVIANIDTDVIIRVERMSTRAGEDLKKYAFEALRYLPDGSINAACRLNQEAFAGAPILIAGPNFGCGSSREPAVWSLMALGIRCVVAESFGDIFFSNCFQNGVLALVLSKAEIEHLSAEAEHGSDQFVVDLVAQLITSPSGQTIAFQVDPQRRESLIEGLDEVGQTLKWDADIEAWQARNRQQQPWVWLSESRQLPQ